MPPAIVAIAGFDTLRDEGEAYVERLRDAGVMVERKYYPSLIHGFMLMTDLSRASMNATLEVARLAGDWLRYPRR